jgi:hypothetical protein
MKYTREQAEAVLREYGDSGFWSVDSFLNAKFPTIEVGKWYKSKNGALIRATSEALEEGYVFTGFGINAVGQWDFSEGWVTECFTPATEQEVLDRLTEEAKKRYKVGDRVRSLFDGNLIARIYESSAALIDSGFFWFSGAAVLNLSTGEWAEVVESNPIQDKIEKLERELAELKQLINK